MNDALFMGFLKIGQLLSDDAETSASLARLMVMGLLALLIGVLSIKAAKNNIDFCNRCFWIIALLYLLSPTQFPWYYLWMLPLLAIRPRTSMLLYAVLLPMYYSRFYYSSIGNDQFFDYTLVWFQHLPPILLLLLEILCEFRKAKVDSRPSET